MANAYDYATANREQFLQQFLELIRIPSVGTDPGHAADTARAAEWLVKDMRRIGLQRVEAMHTPGNPVVYGEWLEAGDDAPTVLIYAHYDVQPAQLDDGWDSEPFEPSIRNGIIFARGAADDKCNTAIGLKAMESMLATKSCPVNVKLLFEGEEESGSPSLPGYIDQNLDLLRADAAIIADGGIDTADQPVIMTAMRGIVAFEVNITGPKTDLHSGSYGGTVHNPAQVIGEMVAKLHREDGSVAVPGFYDEVTPLTETERAAINQSGMTRETWDELAGAPQPWGEAGYSLAERIGARPTLEINGISGGYAGEGSKTVIPSRARVKITCRLVAKQKPDVIYQRVTDYIRQIAPPTVKVEFQFQGSGAPVLLPIDSPMIQALVRAFRLHWSKDTLFRRSGGTIPVIGLLQDKLGISGVPFGFSLEDCNIHGPNENYHVDLYYKGIDTLIRFLEEIAAGS